MTRTIKLVSFLLFVSALVTVRAHAATYTAASCNESDVQAAYSSEQVNHADGDIISIPAGTCTWTTTWTFSPSNTLTFQGAGAQVPSSSCTFAPGSACTTTEGSDLTVLQDGEGTSNDAKMMDITIATGKTFRITQVEYYVPNGANTSGSGAWAFHGLNAQVRLDHIHFNGYQTDWILISGWLFGVADHNLVEMYHSVPIWINTFNARDWNNDSTSYGNASWADDSYWGSNKAFFQENNVITSVFTGTGIYLNDCGNGGRQVFRYNTFLNINNVIQAHEGAHDSQGCRTTEVYGNTSTPTGVGVLVGTRSGSAYVWGNVGSWARLFTPSIDRTSSVNGFFNSPPGDLGMCGQGASGTATWASNGVVTWTSGRNGGQGPYYFQTDVAWPNVSTPNMVLNGTSYPIASCADSTHCTLTGVNIAGSGNWYVPSVWDGNTDSTGYPCYDQPGRGKGDLVTGSFSTNNRVDSATGTATWPNQQLDPSYVFANTNSYSSPSCVPVNAYDAPLIQANRDYYQQFSTGCESGSFDGTKGVGQGLLSERPANCTKNVGYWATDTSTLYRCSVTGTPGTWSTQNCSTGVDANGVCNYTPYTYPHPLTQSTSGSPVAPTGLSAIVN